MNNRSKIILSLAFIGLIACTSEKNIATVETPTDKLLAKGDAVGVEAMARANNAFALDIFKQVAANNADAGFFISPFSISAALAMTYAGAGGTTETEMSKTLYWKGNTEATHQAFGDLIGNMQKASSGKEFTLNIANRLYTQEGIKLYKQFSDINAQKYGASVQSLDFGKTEEAAKAINIWVSEQTQKMIPELLKPSVLEGAKLVLVNAVYFYGGWANKFEEESTQKDTFWTKPESPTVTDFMNNYWNAEDSESKYPFAYTENKNFQVLSLPYHEGKGNMVIFLPKQDSQAMRLQEAILSLNMEDLQNSLQSLSPVSEILDLKLPKWKQRSQFELVDVFKSLGLNAPFNDKADFSRITPEVALEIGAIIHEAVVEVSEKGTKAAASTAVITKATSTREPNEPQIITFHANRPFFYMIRDNATGSILFMGRYN